MPRAKLLLARVPFAYDLAHRCATWLRFALRRPNEADFAAFRHFRDRDGVFLDVGANIGQSAMSFRCMHPTAPILSIEANPGLERDLRRVKRFVRNFDYRICAASDVAGPVTLHIPVFGGLALTGEATMHASSARDAYWVSEQGVADDGDRLEVRDEHVQSIRLDDLGLAPAFVKIDVEGFELQVLRGLSATLEQHHPIVLVERPEGPGVHDFLAALGYRPYVYVRREDRLEPDHAGDSQNVFYLPQAEALGAATG